MIGRIAIVAVLTAATVATATIGWSPPPRDGDGPRLERHDARTSAAPRPTLRIEGTVRGLYPGRVATMRLRIRNPNPFRIRVRVVRTNVRRGAPGCPGRMLVVRKARPRRSIRPRRAIVVPVRVRMRPKAPDACIGARFPLRFRATGVRA